MIEITPMTPEDVRELKALLPDCAEALNKMIQPMIGQAVCGRYAGLLLGAGGIHRDWSGAGRCWLILTPCGQHMPVGAVLAIRRHLAKVAWAEQYTRLEAYARCDDPEAIKLLRVLGFRREGRCQAYFPDGTDAYLYAWVRGKAARKWVRQARLLHDRAS